MLIKLHSQATTTPKIRAAIPASNEPTRVVAERHGTTEQTVYKWKKRNRVTDQSYTPQRLTPLTPAQEAIAVALPRRFWSRATILLPPLLLLSASF